jgi:outer membrane immunogenic protein
LSGAPVRWDGVVLGAQVGYSSMNSDFGNATSLQIAYMLRNTTLEAEDSPSSWTTLPSKLTSSNSFGVFLGYNMQMDDLVLGADIAYSRPLSLNAAAGHSIARTVTLNDGTVDNVSISAASSLNLTAAPCARAPAMHSASSCLMRFSAARSGASTIPTPRR